MAHGFVLWRWGVFATLLRATSGTPLPSLSVESVLDALFYLLALAFLLAGIVAFWRLRKQPVATGQSQANPDMARKPATSMRRIIPVPPIIALALSLVTLLVVLFSIVPAASGTANGNGLAHTPTKKTPVPTPPVSPPSDLLTPGKLTVGTDPSFPLETYTDPDSHNIVGFDIDLINAIAQQMGLTMTPKPDKYKQLTPDLSNGEFDVVIAAIPVPVPVDPTKGQYIPYLAPGDVILVPQNGSQLSTFNGFSDLCGHTIGVQTGTTEQGALTNANNTTCKQNLIQIKPSGTANAVGEALLASNSQVQAIYTDSPTASYYLNKKFPGAFKQLGKKVPIPQEGILIRSNDTSMLTAVQSAFNRVVQTGKYAALLNTWGLTADSVNLAPTALLKSNFWKDG